METSKVNLRLNPIDIFFLLRPPMLVPVWVFFLAGYWRTVSVRPVAIPLYIRSALTPRGYFWLSFVSFSLVMGAVYIINQIVDSESDRVNQKLFLIPLGIVPVRLAFVVVAILFIASFAIGGVFGVRYMVLLGISFIIGILYSVRPFRLKGRPVLDILANAVGYGVLAFSIGWVTDACFTVILFFRSIPYFFAAATIFSSSTLLDMEGDRKDGALTTAVRLGGTPTLIISLVMLLAALVSAVILTDYVIGITSIIGLPLIGIALAKRDRQFITLYMRGTSYVFILLIGLLFPWFLGLLLFVFFSARLYYRYRFGMVYPKLLEKEA